MKLSILVALIITSIILASVGIISVYRPKIIGTEFVWNKSSRFYVLKPIEPTNNYYLRYIKIIGVGFILSGLILLMISIIYFFNPSILGIT